ncbi:N-acetylgalactosamine-N,N '-diacetylbacillosaminyl-diphospho-undecaprenol 4-alpha-N-acetylgalactosaminyltransferase [Halioglobus japonicus]|nr:N-acetylgalactosamine-N,N '-diacetylbacillosaminyl-diphospho-undecaprenol 4-alpha-N-acetylgalactosaminyltransferase [Halioglobus japonicus]
MSLETAQTGPHSVAPHQGSARRVAFLLDNLNGGGAERVVLAMASGFAALGYDVDLLVCEFQGELCGSVPPGVNLIVLKPVGKLAGLSTAVRRAGWQGLHGICFWLGSARKIPRSFRYIHDIADYLQRETPAVIFSALGKSSISTVLAMSGLNIPTRVFVGVQIALSIRSELSRKSGKGQAYSMVPMFRYCFSQAQGVIAASRGVAEDAVELLGLDPERVHVVYNPVAEPEPAGDPAGDFTHPWFQPDAPPVILGMGRLVEQKNFPLLIRAFAAVRQQAEVRLVIVGGDMSSAEQMAHRQELQELAVELGVGDDVALPGYQSDPHAYLRAARVFVLSSSFEGFGNVLVEALLQGCPVVSTDCPSGPAEILEDGRYGTLVPVDDVARLADGILASLAQEPDTQMLRQRGREFSVERALEGYHRILFGDGPACLPSEPGESSSVKPSSYATKQANGNHRMIHNSLGRVTT